MSAWGSWVGWDEWPEHEQEGSGMGVLRHWVAHWDHGKVAVQAHVVSSAEGADQHRANGWRVEGPFVLEADQRGAVALLDEMADVLARVIGPEPPEPGEIDAVLRRALADRHLRGGQSETPAAPDDSQQTETES